MITLGIDPGTTRIGFGVVAAQGSRMEALEYGIISNPGKNHSRDLLVTAKAVRDLVKKHRPDRAGIEKLFFTNNRTTGIAVAEMRGVVLLIFAELGVPVFEFTPQQIKQAVSGYGRAHKNQVEAAVRMILGIRTTIHPDDAADGLAAAICATVQDG